MRPHELRELLEGRREYATGETVSDEITEMQQDLDLLENEYEQKIKELLNGTGYKVENLTFNIDVVKEITNKERGIRHIKVKRSHRMLRPEHSD